MTLRAVVFDYGGTLTEPYSTALPGFFARTGLDPRALRDVLAPLSGAEDGTDSIAHRAERGEVPLAEVVATLEAIAPGAGALFDPATTPLVDLELNPAMGRLVRDVRAAGLQTALLSNIFLGLDELYRLEDGAFDHVVFSCRVGMRKPEPGIYRHVLDLLGVAPDEALFVDDFPAMCEGARAVGMAAVCVTDHAAAVTEVRALLGLTAPAL